MGPSQPNPTLDDAAQHRGLRAYQADGVCSQVRDALLSGPLLVGYALLLGASNTQVGLLAALGPATQILQLPTVALIERSRRRKAICLWAALVGRTTALGLLVLPWAVPTGARVPGLFGILLVMAAFGTVSGAAWNPWMRDFLPEERRNRVVARRMAIATAIGAPLALGAGIAIDRLRVASGTPAAAYVMVLGVGVLAGLAGLIPLGRIPEPGMAPARRRPWRDVVRAPFRHPEFRALVAFLATWTFATNLSAPFFTVYLLRRLGLPMAAVLAATVLSQVTTVLVLRAWGAVADRFQTLTVLRVSCAGFLLSVAGWPIAGMLHTPWLVLVVIGVIHLLAGLTTAGVTLTTSTVAMELAPRGEAAGYLATNALISGAAAALAPVIAGVGADWLETQRLSLTLAWTSTLGPGRSLALRPLDLHGLDFLFVATVLAGLYAVHRILAVVESAQADRRVIVAALVEEIRGQMPQPLRALTTVPGIREAVYFPLSVLGALLPERRARGRGTGPAAEPSAEPSA
ncbi:MAG TPA: MFS transporter [Gemmatimonadales bacterium]|nr:MFS transporter [Gemmatimonadales bacterium]